MIKYIIKNILIILNFFQKNKLNLYLKMSYFIQKDPNYNVNTNRLLNETENLNSKVEQYRKTLLLGFPSSRNDSINMTMFKTGGIYNPNPNIQINSLNSLSKEFVSMSKKPEDLIQEISNNFPVKNSNNNINDIYINNLKQSYEKHINDLYSNFKLCLCKLEEISENYIIKEEKLIVIL